MSISPADVPFARSSPMERSAAGFESMAAPPTDQRSPVTRQQRARAEDLFLRGLLTPSQRERAITDQGGFESLIGRSNFLPAVFLEIGAAVSRATCLIRASGVDFLGRTGRWTGTGSLVSASVLLTNHHVLNSREVATGGECVFDFQTGSNGQPLPTRSFRIRPDRLFITSPAIDGLDFTFVWVDGEPGADFGYVRIDRNALRVAERDFANIIGHPDGRMKEVCLQENTVLWQDDTVVHYTSDTEHGSSGASVANNEWNVFALHHANKPAQVGPHSVLNEGIKLSAIAARLEQMAQSSESHAPHAREVLRIFTGVDQELGFFGTLGRQTKPVESELEAVVDGYEGTEQDIDVGFWNVEWLSNRWESKTKDVARVVHAMKLDVWSLEESSPNAAQALVHELHEVYGLDYDWAAAEPESTDGKQSCTVIWNRQTVECFKQEWGEPIETWLRSRSRDFRDLGFEAVHGKIFDRYPQLFKIVARRPTAGQTFDFYLVPLHLKAKAEGALRRRMASQILAAAVQRKMDDGADADWIIGGDVNAELASGDFGQLISGGLAPVSAQDEDQGAFTYLKFHKSMIDHVFLSPNLTQQFGSESFFIVAADRELPDFVSDVSDHRPVLLRLSVSAVEEDGGEANAEALAELKGFLEQHANLSRPQSSLRTHAPRAARGGPMSEAKYFEASRADFSDRDGFSTSFLGGPSHHVPLPGFSQELAEHAVVLNDTQSGPDRYRLDYMHFSVAMNGSRRLPIYSAVNIDGSQMRNAPRMGWKFDPRIANSLQAGDDIYRNNDLDKGHMTRRLDPVWGTPHVADIANRDSMFYTNAAPQHKDLNQKDWLLLEDYVLGNSKTHDLKVSVFTGPVFGESDKPYRGIRLPAEFWKVVVMRRSDTDELSATGYLLTQQDLITGFEFVFGEFKTFQVTLSDIEARTGLQFHRLKDFDPKDRMLGGLEAAGPRSREIRGPEDIVL